MLCGAASGVGERGAYNKSAFGLGGAAIKVRLFYQRAIQLRVYFTSEVSCFSLRNVGLKGGRSALFSADYTMNYLLSFAIRRMI